MNTRLMLVAGARPNYMKIAPIYWAVREQGADAFLVEVVHTGQHYDADMSGNFFRDLGLPEPTINLGVGSGSHAAQTAKVMTAFEAVVLQRRPDVVVVVGDVNSTLACALVTSKIAYDGRDRSARPLLAHVEAGLRSRDRSMPEEINRIVTDALSDVLFTTCRDGDENLRAEGVATQHIHFVGNTMIDSLRRCLPLVRHAGFLDQLGLKRQRFGLCTLHRPSNVDDPRIFEDLLGTLAEVASDVPVLMPLHPRTRQRIEQFGFGDRVVAPGRSARLAPRRGLIGLAPFAYPEMLQTLDAAQFVFTDSGGVQEEATALGVACVTLRENTERPVTIREGTNVLSGRSRQAILDGLQAARRKAGGISRGPELWDGRAGERIVQTLLALPSVEQANARSAERYCS